MSEIRVSKIRVSKIRVSEIRVSEIRGSEIRVSEIRVSKIRGSEIRVTEIRISSNHRELDGAIFFSFLARQDCSHVRISTARTLSEINTPQTARV